MSQPDNKDGYENSGQAFEADLNAITDPESGIKEEEQQTEK